MSRVEISIECTARLRWWARVLLWSARVLVRVAGAVATFAVNHGVKVKIG